MRARIAVKAINIKTGEVLIFSSAYEAAKRLNLSQSSVNRCVNGHLHRVGVWGFMKINWEEEFKKLEAKQNDKNSEE